MVNNALLQQARTCRRVVRSVGEPLSVNRQRCSTVQTRRENSFMLYERSFARDLIGERVDKRVTRHHLHRNQLIRLDLFYTARHQADHNEHKRSRCEMKGGAGGGFERNEGRKLVDDVEEEEEEEEDEEEPVETGCIVKSCCGLLFSRK